jgi:hypothetical protein
MPWAMTGADALPDGSFACAGTHRKQLTIWRVAGTNVTPLHTGPGKEFTAVCTCGPRVVCATATGPAYVFDTSDGTPRTFKLPPLPAGEKEWIYGAASLDGDTVLIGGTHGLVFLTPSTGQATRRRLSEFGVRRPGRTIHNIVRAEDGRAFVIGAKGLFVEYRHDAGGSVRELTSGPTVAGHEAFFQGAAECGGEVYASWFSGAHAFLSVHRDGTFQPVDMPIPITPGHGTAALCGDGTRLIVAKHEVAAGVTGDWQVVGRFSDPKETTVAVTRSPVGSALVVGANGSLLVRVGEEWRSTSIPQG